MQECEKVRFLCHSCRKAWFPDYLIPCKATGCGHFFCYKCLTGRYKYSQSKSSRFPSATWKCPMCTGNCHCEECQSGKNKGIARKAIKKTSIRKKSYTKIKLNSSRKPSKFYSRVDANTKTLSDDRYTRVISTPKVHRILPPISCKFLLQFSIY